jgi:hypothetical protein
MSKTPEWEYWPHDQKLQAPANDQSSLFSLHLHAAYSTPSVGDRTLKMPQSLLYEEAMTAVDQAKVRAEGVTAYRAAVSRHHCPYPYGSAIGDVWQAGWFAARDGMGANIDIECEGWDQFANAGMKEILLDKERFPKIMMLAGDELEQTCFRPTDFALWRRSIKALGCNVEMWLRALDAMEADESMNAFYTY